jgi:hypothetical protein
MNFPPARLSKHAIDRVIERFSIAPEQLTTLLNTGLGKGLGATGRSSLIHRLVWSPSDADFLVAIQNIISGWVLTVLTVAMYRRDYDANLTDQRLRHVVNQMVHAELAPGSRWTSGDRQEYVTIYAYLGGATQPVALGRWNGAVTSPDLSQLGCSMQFWTWVAGRLKERQHTIDALLSVQARFTGGRNYDVPYRVTGEG